MIHKQQQYVSTRSLVTNTYIALHVLYDQKRGEMEKDSEKSDSNIL